LKELTIPAPATAEARQDFFRTHGYLTDVPCLDNQALGLFRAHVDRLEQAVGQETMRIGMVDRHFDHDFLMQVALAPTVLDRVEELLGPNILLLATHFFCKYGHDGKWVAWHQDVTYWGLEPPTAVTAWLAVDDVDAENGCMRVIPGSHKGGIRHHGKADAEGNLLSINQACPVTVEEEDTAVDVPLAAGRMSIHDGCLVHGSLPNLSGRRRCGLTLRYVPASVRQVCPNSHGGRWRTVLARGVADPEGL